MLQRNRALKTPLQFVVVLIWPMIAMVISGCLDGSDSSSVSDGYLPISNPVVELPPDVGEPFLGVADFDLADFGYIEEEFFVSGTANAFKSLNEFHPDGFWETEPGETASYKTRIVVIRPIDAADFNGTVMVEWINSALAWER
ncbi:alpha/beta hydrolase domain-containing protein, partial [Pseudomonadota bacterium]